MREDLTHHVLFFQLLHPHLDEALKWAKVLVDDSDLKDYMHKELDRDERDYEERLKKLRLFKRYMKRLVTIAHERSLTVLNDSINLAPT